MKKLTSLLIGVCSSFLLSGCFGSSVSTTCRQSENGATMAVKFSAPSKNKNVNKMVMVLEISLDEMDLIDQDFDRQEMQDEINSMEESYKLMLKSVYGINPSDVVMRMQDNTLYFEVSIQNMEDVMKKMGSDKESLNGSIFKKVLEDAEDSGFTCS